MRLIAPLSLAGGVLTLACAASPAAAAPLANGDFSAGFAGWIGQTIACGDVACTPGADVTTDLDPPPGAFTPNFDATGGAATIATSFSDNAVYSTSLRQLFDVDEIQGRNTGLALALDIDYALSDPFTDLVIAQLTDPSGSLPAKDLLDGGPVDITAYAGRAAEIYFEITDFVDGQRDTLTIGNISVEQVPAPAPLGLLMAGLGLLAGRRLSFQFAR
jgi:hypothetical protein